MSHPPAILTTYKQKERWSQMTTLTKTQYLLTWVGSNMGWTGTIQALCESETKAWDYLSQKVLEGWVVLETTLTEVK